jgi:hypothetical protein
MGLGGIGFGLLGSTIMFLFPKHRVVAWVVLSVGLVLFLCPIISWMYISSMRTKQIGPLTLVGLGVVLIFCAIVWQIILEKKLVSSNTSNTKFALSIDAANIFVPNGNMNQTELILYVSIDNIGGEPSIAKDWGLSVSMDDETPVNAVFLRLGNTSGIVIQPGNITVTGKDALEDKTENIPVVGKVRGSLLFLLPDTSKERMIMKNTKLTLSVKDKNNEIYNITETIDEISKK